MEFETIPRAAHGNSYGASYMIVTLEGRLECSTYGLGLQYEKYMSPILEISCLNLWTRFNST